MNLHNFSQKFKTKPKFFFVGIGGISMSALAKFFIINGYYVSGSDKVSSQTTSALKELGCEIFIGHDKNNLKNADIVVYNSAIDNNNEELKFAIENNLLIIKRVDLLQIVASSFLKSIGVSGSHGKTTTTAIISHVLYNSNLGFTCHIGGYDNVLGNLYQNGKEIFVTEVCEFNKNIDSLNLDIGLCLNVDNDHLNCYENFNQLKQTFYNYLNRCKIAVVNVDDVNLRKYSLVNKNAVTISLFYDKADYYCKILSCNNYNYNIRIFEKGKKLFDAKVHYVGIYNLYNALGAIAVSRQLNLEIKEILNGLNSFNGVQRRNEFMGKIKRAKIICDYAHHPKELECSIKSQNCQNKKIFVVFQPHTYSRTKLLFKEFFQVLSKVENLYLYKTYSAREKPADGYDCKFLAKKLNCKNYFDNFESLIKRLKEDLTNNCVVLVLGAGDLYDNFKEYFSQN